MKEFIAIDFETGNPKRVSACSLGYAKVVDGQIIESNKYLINPVGGHAPFQSRIHGIKAEHTKDAPDFSRLFPTIKNIFEYPLVAHSLFDKQVLIALSDYYSLGLSFEYIDSSAIAKQKLPDLKNHKLKTLAKHFKLPTFKHHDAKEDAIACASIFLKLHEAALDQVAGVREDKSEYVGLAKGILADDEVNYKEVYELLYWLEDHEEVARREVELYQKVQEVLSDDNLDNIESIEVKELLENSLRGYLNN